MHPAREDESMTRDEVRTIVQSSINQGGIEGFRLGLARYCGVDVELIDEIAAELQPTLCPHPENVAQRRVQAWGQHKRTRAGREADHEDW